MHQSDQVGLVFLLIYACGALVELLIRMSLGVPAWAKPAFEQHICLVILQPFVFILIPALIWPLIVLYRIFRPLYDILAECFARRRAARTETAAAAAANTTAGRGQVREQSNGVNGDRIALTTPASTRTSITSTIHDLEKQEIRIETTSVPSTSRNHPSTE